MTAQKSLEHVIFKFEDNLFARRRIERAIAMAIALIIIRVPNPSLVSEPLEAIGKETVTVGMRCIRYRFHSALRNLKP